MNPADFNFVESLLRRESGIALTPEKLYLVEARLGPVAASCGMPSIDALVAEMRRHAEITRRVVEAMTTNETSFFRDEAPFRYLREEALPRLHQGLSPQKKIRIWSAACATGQEPYSVAILLREMGIFDGWQVEIHATDLSQEALRVARGASYSQFEVQRGLPVRLLLKYFTKEGERWRAVDSLRAMVSFAQGNLLGTNLPTGAFDIILCRNVLMYFEPAERLRVLERLRPLLRPEGYLVTGGAELMPAAAFKPVAPGLCVYRVKNAAP